MKCKQYLERLEDWLDGELDKDQHAAMEEHGVQCPDCALVLAQRRTMGAALKKNLHGLTAELHFQPRAVNGLLIKNRLPGQSPWLHFNARALMALAAVTLIVLLFSFQPWTKLRQKSAAVNLPTVEITVSDSLDAVDESFISGHIDGFTYLIHLRVSAIKINDHS